MNRLVSNLILGFFALTLMAVYGFAKQPTVYSMMMQKNTKPANTAVEQNDTRRVILPNGTTIAVKLAETDDMRTKGLGGVERLENNAGMLFVFNQPGTYAMWMKDMKIPIDMVWLDEQGRVVYLASQVQPPKDDQTDIPTYVNTLPAKYVLELSAGEADKTGIKEGVQLKLT